MKKATLTIGLFALVLASTSFASPTASTSTIDDSVITSIDGKGGQDSGGQKKLDFNGDTVKSESTVQYNDIDGKGGQDSGGQKRLD